MRGNSHAAARSLQFCKATCLSPEVSRKIVLGNSRGIWIICLALPVVAGSIILSSWARWEPHAGASRNRVYVTPRSVSDPLADVLPATTESLRAACNESSRFWLDRLGAEYGSVIRGPFVLIAAQTEAELAEWYTHFIRSSVAAMYDEYFDTPVSAPVVILMFADEESYLRFGHSHSSHREVSVYGYYKPATRTIVVNLAAGEGTLIHELTHALMDFDYPDAPRWLNEGIASLHEECRIDMLLDQHLLQPLDNWRLRILQDAVRSGRVVTTPELMASAMAGDEEAIHYAQARYLCMFLRQRGQLPKVYRRFRQEMPDQTEATELLERLLRHAGWQDFADFDQQFQRWVVDQLL